MQAKELGYTEPDPRDDLAGMDVARKVTILARCARYMFIITVCTVPSIEPSKAKMQSRMLRA